MYGHDTASKWTRMHKSVMLGKLLKSTKGSDSYILPKSNIIVGDPLIFTILYNLPEIPYNLYNYIQYL